MKRGVAIVEWGNLSWLPHYLDHDTLAQLSLSFVTSIPSLLHFVPTCILLIFITLWNKLRKLFNFLSLSDDLTCQKLFITLFMLKNKLVFPTLVVVANSLTGRDYSRGHP